MVSLFLSMCFVYIDITKELQIIVGKVTEN